MDDNLYPRSSRFLLNEPEAQVQERNKEQAQVTAALPKLQEIVERLNERIAFYASIDAIPAELDTDPEKHMHTVAANRLTRDNLEAEKSIIEELISAHSK